MPIAIGQKPSADFTDPIGLLTDCHRRIERFLTVLVNIANRPSGEPLASNERHALETALRYFKEAAPKHTLDEEDSLFPRLFSSNDPRVKQLAGLIQHLNDDHRTAQDWHAEIDRIGNEWLVEGDLSGRDAHRLREMLDNLSEFYREHIASEESQVFSVASQVLTREDVESIGREMAGRRGMIK